jgi:hypothetical protein
MEEEKDRHIFKYLNQKVIYIVAEDGIYEIKSNIQKVVYIVIEERICEQFNILIQKLFTLLMKM